MQNKRLTRSMDDAVLGGVCSGFGHYFGIDPTVIRVAWAAVSLLGGAGILLYIVCLIIMPQA